MRNQMPANIIYRLFGFIILIALIIGIVWFFKSSLQENIAIKINRTGMILELLGVFSVIPEIVGDRKLREAEKKFGSFAKQIRAFQKDVKRLIEEGIDTVLDNSDLPPSGIIGSLIIMGNIIGSFLIIISFDFQQLADIKSRNLFAGIFFYGFYMTPFIWIIIGSIFFIYLKFKKKQEANTLLNILFLVFFITHFILSLFSLPFIIALGILFQFGFTISSLLLKLSFRQIITWVTLPLVILGNLLQLISTFF